MSGYQPKTDIDKSSATKRPPKGGSGVYQMNKIVKKLIPPSYTEDDCYLNGVDAGLNGANEINCHFSNFATQEKMERWTAGKREGERQKKAVGRSDKPDGRRCGACNERFSSAKQLHEHLKNCKPAKIGKQLLGSTKEG